VHAESIIGVCWRDLDRWRSRLYLRDVFRILGNWSAGRRCRCNDD